VRVSYRIVCVSYRTVRVSYHIVRVSYRIVRVSYRIVYYVKNNVAGTVTVLQHPLHEIKKLQNSEVNNI
jgi:hypothetical protein